MPTASDLAAAAHTNLALAEQYQESTTIVASLTYTATYQLLAALQLEKDPDKSLDGEHQSLSMYLTKKERKLARLWQNGPQLMGKLRYLLEFPERQHVYGEDDPATQIVGRNTAHKLAQINAELSTKNQIPEDTYAWLTNWVPGQAPAE